MTAPAKPRDVVSPHFVHRWPTTWEATDLTDFRCVIVVAEEQSISRAADRLYLSQSALSRRILRLERAVGTALLVRHARSVSLTAAGVAMAAHAERVLNAAGAALVSARDAGLPSIA